MKEAQFPGVLGSRGLGQEEETQVEALGTGKPPSGCPELSNAAWGCSGCAPVHAPQAARAEVHLAKCERGAELLMPALVGGLGQAQLSPYPGSLGPE